MNFSHYPVDMYFLFFDMGLGGASTCLGVESVAS